VSERDLFAASPIRATTEELKRGRDRGSVLAEVANWAGAMVEAAAKVINATRIYNLIVTNAPGPSFRPARGAHDRGVSAPAAVRAAGIGIAL
jgi:hypothetical protein